MNEYQISNIYATGEKISNGVKLLTLEQAERAYTCLTYPRILFNNTLGVVRIGTDGTYAWIPVTLDDYMIITK